MGITAGTAAAIGAGAALIGTGVSAYGAMQQGEAQKKAADYQSQVARNNATVAAQNAAAVQDQAAAKAQATERAGAIRLGAQRAALAAGGVTLDSGSALDVQGATAEATALGAENDKYQGQLSAYGYESQGVNFNAQAGLDTLQGDNASTAGLISAGGTLLSGAGQVASKWASFKSAPVSSGTGYGAAP